MCVVICLYACLCTTCVLQAYGGQKRVLDPPEIKWQMVVSHRVLEYKTPVLWKSGQCL